MSVWGKAWGRSWGQAWGSVGSDLGTGATPVDVVIRRPGGGSTGIAGIVSNAFRRIRQWVVAHRHTPAFVVKQALVVRVVQAKTPRLQIAARPQYRAVNAAQNARQVIQGARRQVATAHVVARIVRKQQADYRVSP